MQAYTVVECEHALLPNKREQFGKIWVLYFKNVRTFEIASLKSNQKKFDSIKNSEGIPENSRFYSIFP